MNRISMQPSTGSSKLIFIHYFPYFSSFFSLEGWSSTIELHPHRTRTVYHKNAGCQGLSRLQHYIASSSTYNLLSSETVMYSRKSSRVRKFIPLQLLIFNALQAIASSHVPVLLSCFMQMHRIDTRRHSLLFPSVHAHKPLASIPHYCVRE